MGKLTRWTQEDKVSLLHGLRTYGHRDAPNIQKLLPHKSIGAIRTMMYKYSLMAKMQNKRTNPLEEWLLSNHFSRNDNTLIHEALLYICLFENHPPPSETGGINIEYDSFQYL